MEFVFDMHLHIHKRMRMRMHMHMHMYTHMHMHMHILKGGKERERGKAGFRNPSRHFRVKPEALRSEVLGKRLPVTALLCTLLHVGTLA